jgi:hypothetical protein
MGINLFFLFRVLILPPGHRGYLPSAAGLQWPFTLFAGALYFFPGEQTEPVAFYSCFTGY